HKSRPSELVGGTYARGDAAAFRARSGSDPRGLQSANAPRLAHAGNGGRELSLHLAKDRGGHEVWNCRLPNYRAQGNDVFRTAARCPRPSAGKVSRPFAG